MTHTASGRSNSRRSYGPPGIALSNPSGKTSSPDDVHQIPPNSAKSETDPFAAAQCGTVFTIGHALATPRSRTRNKVLIRHVQPLTIAPGREPVVRPGCTPRRPAPGPGRTANRPPRRHSRRTRPIRLMPAERKRAGVSESEAWVRRPGDAGSHQPNAAPRPSQPSPIYRDSPGTERNPPCEQKPDTHR